MRKSTKLPHRNRSKTNRLRAKLRAKLRRVRLRRTSGERKFHR
jgi:hypothetical protein